MTGKELIFSALKNEKPERVPYLPFVGVHAASLIGCDAEIFLKDPDKIIEGLKKAHDLYQPDGLPVCFDLQIEAEALGCSLAWAKDNPPAVTSHALAGKELTDLPKITEKSGRIPVVLKVAEELRKAFPDIALYGLITGPFTLALHLLGPNIFMDMYDKPDYVKEVVSYCTGIAKDLAAWYLDKGCDVIAVVDPMTSQIGPDDFNKFVKEYCADIFTYVKDRDAFSSFFVCGHAQKNIEVMCQCAPDNISIDENIPLDYVRDIARQYKVSFGGNMKLTAVMLFGDTDANIRDAAECLSLGEDTGFILAPGCDIPYAVPSENIKAVAEMIKDPYKIEVAMKMVGTGEALQVDLDMSDYGIAEKIKVDIITLDSEACAPCQYMVEAVKDVLPEFEDVVDWQEHKIKTKEAMELMAALSVSNIPTICIDGKVEFVSNIPPRDELRAVIYKRMIERAKYRKAATRLIFLDDGSEKAKQMQENIDKAKKELGSSILVDRVTDPETIKAYMIHDLPAVIASRQELKSFGKVVDKEVVKEWIKNLQ